MLNARAEPSPVRLATMAPTNRQTTITPSKSSQGLKDKINWLNDMYQLDLYRDDKTYSPSASANVLADSVYGLIKRLYFTDEPGLRTALRTFGRETNDGQTQVERLKLLQKTLKDNDMQKARGHDTRTGSQSPVIGSRGSIRGLEVPRSGRFGECILSRLERGTCQTTKFTS